MSSRVWRFFIILAFLAPVVLAWITSGRIDDPLRRGDEVDIAARAEALAACLTRQPAKECRALHFDEIRAMGSEGEIVRLAGRVRSLGRRLGATLDKRSITVAAIGDEAGPGLAIQAVFSARYAKGDVSETYTFIRRGAGLILVAAADIRPRMGPAITAERSALIP